MKHVPAYEGVAEMRQRPNGTSYPVWTGTVHLAYDRLDWPRRWQRPRMIFVASMSDLFWEQVPDAFVDEVFAVMEETPRHIFQVLTKRPERMRTYLRDRWGESAPAHIWVGTSTEDQTRADERVIHLIHTPAAVRFLSAEPLLGPIDLTRLAIGGGFLDALRCDYHDGGGTVLAGPPAGSGPVTWVIAGGESGPGYRPMDAAWPAQLRDQCGAAGVAFWYKQGSAPRNEHEPHLGGWKFRQFPHERPLRPPEPYGSCPGENIHAAFPAAVLV